MAGLRSKIEDQKKMVRKIATSVINHSPDDFIDMRVIETMKKLGKGKGKGGGKATLDYNKLEDIVEAPAYANLDRDGKIAAIEQHVTLVKKQPNQKNGSSPVKTGAQFHQPSGKSNGKGKDGGNTGKDKGKGKGSTKGKGKDTPKGGKPKGGKGKDNGKGKGKKGKGKGGKPKGWYIALHATTFSTSREVAVCGISKTCSTPTMVMAAIRGIRS